MAQNKIVNPDEFQTKVSRENKALIQDFLDEKRAQGKRPKTIYQYEHDMRIIVTLLYRHFDNKSLLELTRKDIRKLVLIFQDMGMSNARINRLASCLRSALSYFEEDDEIDYQNNVAHTIKGLPKDPVKEIVFLKDEWIYMLRDELIRRDNLLVAMYLMLSYITAGRKNEILQILKNGLLDGYTTNMVVGKRGKKFRLYYDQDTQDIIREYLKQRGDDDIEELFVKVKKDGSKEVCGYGSPDYWCRYMSRILTQLLNTQIKFNPHSLRHSRLENLSTGNNKYGIKVDLSDLQVLANHSDPGTTKNYIMEHKEDSLSKIFRIDPNQFVL
jgi:integrase